MSRQKSRKVILETFFVYFHFYYVLFLTLLLERDSVFDTFSLRVLLVFLGLRHVTGITLYVSSSQTKIYKILQNNQKTLGSFPKILQGVNLKEGLRIRLK